MHPSALLEEAAKALETQLGIRTVSFHASGRDALRHLLQSLAAKSNRREVIVPGYTCYSVAAAAVAAGLEVRLVDVTPFGQIDPQCLARLPLERAAAIIVCNLFGLPEPLGPLRVLTHEAGAGLIDDAAQSFGAADDDGPVGGRGEPAVLSFGRGKPLCALGGGAIAWTTPPPPHSESSGAVASSHWRAPIRALAYSVALQPPIFRALSAIPALEIGVTRFDPHFGREKIDTATLELLIDGLQCSEQQRRERAARAERLAQTIRETTTAVPLTVSENKRGAYPRLGILAPDATAREQALELLARIGAGASGLYPDALCDVAALRPYLVGDTRTPGARELAARILTLPTHAGLDEVRRRQIEACLTSIWSR